MELLKEQIREVARVEKGNVLKVDSFLNHQLDIPLLNEIGKELKKRFQGEKVDKILTAEVSGIAIAAIAAQYFNVPVVFAKKTQSKNLDQDTYEGEVYSYTKGQAYKIRVSKRYLHEKENILIIDDFLANGEALQGLREIVVQANANLVGAGIVIEKGFQGGGKRLRAENMRIESLAIIDEMNESTLVFRDDKADLKADPKAS
ncbi:xanthine phosphoribosyltransferase [Alkaliphilus metalliredigens QYMF]|uniref:Xanthine phosphoribosyltransferase n=1 Tax=Alkaliphilus metalliredigens (strain QYMF) TaxID=293826 RepID=XPT_ALKMQ|nr:xanthine phosphoribosyltransferase [Alkaliphilus metalliredigens]A6TTD6.1 RecName: Full=Xanthine phosphoribosyltransferase; Short=XPRTase [Alkaliphilus metalliredigens QYMF]ABR49454.1 xanthine phosphoribosyltransferase [Alkaliphilus metalliredigens QYMF]